MCLYLRGVWIAFAIITIALIFQIEAKGHDSIHHKSGHENAIRNKKVSHEIDRRTHVSHDRHVVTESKKPTYRRSMKRVNVTQERKSNLLSRKAEDILMDEITGSDQAANRAEISYNIPKELEFLKSSMKEGDITDIDTANMIDLNERKGAYLPVSQVKASINNRPAQNLLTEQFRNISGLPEFIFRKGSKLRSKKPVSLLEKVAQTLQPSASAISGIKQLIEENKVEQSLKKHLDSLNANLINAIAHPQPNNQPAVVDTVDRAATINTLNAASDPVLNPAYITPVNPDQIYDESISPPEQLLDDLSAGKFKHPLADKDLERMSEWNANKEFLADNGYVNSNEGMLAPKMTRVASDIMPVRDVFLKPKIAKPTEGISKDSLELLRDNPEVLGRNQNLLNSHQFHSLSDLDSIGPPIYPAKIVHLPHKSKHIFMQPKHLYTHMEGGDFHHDVNEGFTMENSHFAMNDDDENDHMEEHMYHPHRPSYSARCSYKPCLNGGKCTAYIDRYVCTCREGFMGINCEKRSYCYPTPCKHGTCSSNTDGFVCTCEMGYQGKRCDERDKCHPSPCMHGGICSSTFSGIYCTCLPGYKGKYCETEAKCSPINPCLNGGRCQEMPSNYICICKNGFAGRNCDAILKPTSLPATLEPKPVPPQAIPIPAHGQPPFLMEELNSLSDGPLEEHPVPETKIDAVPLDDHHGHQVFEEHHFPDIFDDDATSHNHDRHDHDEPQLGISSSPAVVLHLGDRTKDKKKEPPKDDGKKKKNPPTLLKQDDRYVTHLVAAAPMKGKGADDDKKTPEEKKPPMEKPTAKQEKPKERIPTAQTLMRLQNPQNLRMDDNRVYTGATGYYAPGGLDQIAAHGNQYQGSSVYARPAVKHVVVKDARIKSTKDTKPKPGVKLQQKPRVVWAKPNTGHKENSKARQQRPGTKTLPKKPKTSCPGFCKSFCDKWCMNVGCCKKAEIKGPTEAGNLSGGSSLNVVAKKGAAKAKAKCKECSENADCIKGTCKCKDGFDGDGQTCKVNPCIFCHDNATCENNTCVCKVGFLGDGLKCTPFTNHCARCSPRADCIDNFCFCKPGYYGNGNDCWPNTDPML